MTKDRVSNSTILSEHRGIVNARYILSIINFIAILAGTILTNHFVSIRGASRGVAVHIGIIIAVNIIQILLCIGDYVIKQFMGIYFKYLPIISYGVGGLWLLLTIGELFAGSRELGEIRLDLAIVAGIQIVIAFIAYIVWPALDHSAIQRLTTKKAREQAESDPAARTKKARGFIIRYVVICLFVALTQVAMLFAYKVPPRVYDLFSDSRALQYELNDSKDGYIVTGVYLGTSPYANVPATYNNLPVIGVSANAFSNASLIDKYKISKITFGTEELDENGNKTVVSNIKFIEAGAIRNDKIESLTLPSSIVNIEEGAISSNSLTTLVYESKADFSISYLDCKALSTITMTGKSVGNISSLQGMNKNVTIEVDKEIYNEYRKNNFEYVTSFKPILSEDEFCVDFYTGCDYYIESIFSKYGQDIVLSYKDLKNDKMTGISPVVDTLQYIKNNNELGTNGAKKDSAFRGWYTDSSFGQEVNFTINGTVSFSSNTSIYGKWIDEYTGTLDWGTHQPTSAKDKIYWTDEDVVELPVVKNRLGYADGVLWNVRGSKTQITNTRSISGNQTFEATWVLDKPTGVDIIANAPGDWWQASQDGSLVMFTYDELRELTLGAVYGHPLEADPLFDENAKPFTLKWEKIADSSFSGNGMDLISVKNVADSGQYKLTVIFRSPYGEEFEASTTISVNIAKKALDIGTKRFDETHSVIEYTGFRNKLPLTGEYVHSNIKADFAYYDKDDNFLGTSGVTDVGEYKVKVVFSKNNDAEASNYLTAELQTEYEITPIYLDFDGWSTTTLTYNSMPQSVTMKVKKVLAGDEVNLIYKDDANVKTNAGKYRAEVIGVDNPNYSINKIQEQCRVEWEITPKVLTITEWRLDGKSASSKAVYDADYHIVEAFVSGVCAGDRVNVLYNTTVSEINAGVYTAEADDVDNANYTLASTDASFDWEIEKRELIISFNNPSLVYNGTAQGVVATVDNIPSSDKAKFNKSAFALSGDSLNATVDQASMLNAVKISFTATDAGSYEANVLGLASAELLSNYEITTVSKDFTIAKKTIEILSWQKQDLSSSASATTLGSNAELVYNKSGYKISPVLSGVASGDTVTLSVSNGTKYGVGTYTTTASLPTTYKNYTLKNENLSASWKITPKPVNLTWKFNGTTKTGTPSFVYSASSVNVSPSYTGVCAGDTITLAYGESDMSKINVGTYKITVTGVGNSNYTVGTGSEITWKITPKPVNISWNFNGTTKTGTPSFVYSASSVNVSPSYSVYDGDSLSITYGDSDRVKTDVGEYKVSILSLGNSNYTVGTGSEITWKITPKPVEVVWPSVSSSSTYNGAYQGPAFSLNGMCEYVGFRVSTEANGVSKIFELTSSSSETKYSYAVQNQCAINAGIYDFEVKQILKYDSESDSYVADANYEIVDVGHRFTITPKPLALTGIWNYTNSKLSSSQYVSPFVYNKATYTLTTSIDSSTLVNHNGATADVTLVYSGNTGTNANTYTAEVVSLAGAQAGNYTLPTQNTKTTWTINPKPLRFTWDKNETVYNGINQRVTATISSGATTALDGMYYTGDSVSPSYSTGRSAINAGAYSVEVVGVSNSNYCIDETSDSHKHSWIISPKPISLTWGELEYTYNSNVQYPSATYTDSYNTVTAKYLVTPSSKNAGTYEIVAVGVDNPNYILESVQESRTYVIKPFKVTLVWRFGASSASNYVFDGQSRTLKAVVTNAFSGDTVNAEITGDSAVKNAGAYSCTVVGLDNQNYTIEGATSLSKTITVSPRPVTITWLGDTSSSYTYNATARAISAKVTGVNGVELEFEYDTDVREITNVGTITVGIATVADSNYTLVNASNISHSITINPIKLTVAWAGSNATYDGKPHSLTASLSGIIAGDDVDLTYSSTIGNEFVNAGSYTVSVSSVLTGADSGNYTVTSSSKTLTITKKTITVVWSGATSVVYDGSAHSLTASLSGVVAGDDVQFSYSSTIGNDFTDVGSYTVRVSTTLTGNSKGNYALSTSNNSCTLKINPCIVKPTWTIPANLVYDGNPKTDYKCELDKVLIGDGIEYSINKDGAIVDEIRGAGLYTITAVFVDGANYTFENGTNADSTTFTVEKDKVFLEWTNPANLVYNGLTKEYSCVVNNSNGATVSYTIKKDGSKKTEIKDAGNYVITATLNDSDNFVIANASTTSFTIEKCKVTPTWTLPNGAIYDGTAKDWSYTLNDDALTAGAQATHTIKWGSSTTSTIKNAGDYTITLTLSDTANFEFASGAKSSVNVSIAQKEITLIWSENTTFVYDGNGHVLKPQISGGVSGETIALVYSKGGANEFRTVVGTTTYTISGIESTNYKFASGTVLTKDLVITPAPVSIYWPNTKTFVYDGTAHSITPTVTGLKGASVAFIYVDGNSLTNVGAKIVTIELNNANYTLEGATGGASAVLEITPATVTITWPTTTTFTYTGDEISLAPTVVGVGGATVGFNYANGNSLVNVGTKQVAIASLKDANYTLDGAEGKLSCDLTITAQAVRIIWSGNESVVYDGQSHRLTATVTGAITDTPVAFDYESNGFVDVGAYTCKVVLSDSNYVIENPSNAEKALEVTPAEISFVWELPSNLEADGNAKQISVISNGIFNDEVQSVITIEKDGVAVNEIKDAGTYTITVKIEGAKAGNYEIATSSETTKVIEITEPSQVLPPENDESDNIVMN